MPRVKLLYVAMLAGIIGFIGYVAYVNFIHDPQASAFLQHKTNLERPLRTAVWLPVMKVHLTFACLAMAAGAINFSNRILAKFRKFHRFNGYVYFVSVLVVAVSSGYMAPYSTGGKAVSIAFNLLNIAWPLMTIMALVAIKKKRVDRHRHWMVRSYAFCFTNLCIHFLTFVVSAGFGVSYKTSYTIGVYGAMLLLLVLAEIVIRTVYRVPSAFRPLDR